MAYPMGEAKLEPLRVDFDRRLKLEFHGSDISSDGGLLPYRELDHALGLTELGGEVLSETRRGKNTRHLLVTFQMAEVAIPRTLFVEILRLIDGLRPAPLPP